MSHKPNVLFITTDEHHWKCMGYNHPGIKTPNLDKLAAQGTIFDRAYCPNPTCSPTRSSLITGLYPSQHGCYTLGTKLPEDVPTLGEYFQKGGYRTSLYGKAHFMPLRGNEEFPSYETPDHFGDREFWDNWEGDFYGFDTFETTRNHTTEAWVGPHYRFWLEDNGFENWKDWYIAPAGHLEKQHPEKGLWDIPVEAHYNTWLSERVRNKLQEHKDADENFFLWASFPDPHTPYAVPEPWASMYSEEDIIREYVVPGEHDANPLPHQLTQDPEGNFDAYKTSGMGNHGYRPQTWSQNDDFTKKIQAYYGMVSFTDHAIGEILDKLEDLGLAENTLVVFTTDHGHFLGKHGLGAKGAFHYEDLLKVPFISRAPGQKNAGSRTDNLISLVDLPQTFLSYCNLPVPRTMSGVDFTEMFKGDPAPLRDHVLVQNRHEVDTIFLNTYVNERYKLTVYFNQPHGELWDLQEDPDELHNRWADPDYAEIKADLMLKLNFAQMGKDPVPMPRLFGA
ncbi:sulfatase-like hydrolase/transferase [Kiritimatiellaeota bacterium B1221]|nr:sulfatase-like hydrolase/transferase [Kiritimatiellaeota bacterium B1221]